MKLLKKLKNRNEIRCQIGGANRSLEINKIVCKFRDYFNNLSIDERNRISKQLKSIQKEKSDLKLYVFLTSLGAFSGGICLYNLFCGNEQYLLMSFMSIVLCGIELRNSIYSSEYVAENNEKFLDYFKKNIDEDKEINECMGGIPRHKLTGDNLECLKSQLTEDACSEYIRNF